MGFFGSHGSPSPLQFGWRGVGGFEACCSIHLGGTQREYDGATCGSKRVSGGSERTAAGMVVVGFAGGEEALEVELFPRKVISVVASKREEEELTAQR